MSAPTRPARTDAASMTAIRGLLERNLLDRAVALSETRWPGSGPVVELAYEWANLSPSARRERLASIGPEELARLRGVAQLHPDFARVLDDLEARGIIPPESALSPDAQVADEPPTFHEAVVDAAVDYAAQGTGTVADRVQAELPPEVAMAAASAAVAAATAEALGKTLPPPLEPLPKVEMPKLDPGLPSTNEFLEEQAARRQQAAEQASSILDRIRATVDQSAERLLTPPAARPTAPPAPAPTVQETAPPAPPAEVEAASPTEPALAPQQSTRVDYPKLAPPPASQFDDLIVEYRPGEPTPTDAELAAVARQLGLDYVALDLPTMGSRAFFGGLVRERGAIAPRAGAFPTAVSRRSLVAIRGRLYPKTIERLRTGYCDIPGTQATVRLHPDCRIVLLPS